MKAELSEMGNDWNSEVGRGKWEGVKVNAEVGMRKSENERWKEKIMGYGIRVSDTALQTQTILLFGVSTKYNHI